MSDSDKKAPPRIDETDWDSALNDWEKSSFVPEVARDVTNDRPATLTGPASKPLYRPPTPPSATTGGVKLARITPTKALGVAPQAPPPRAPGEGPPPRPAPTPSPLEPRAKEPPRTIDPGPPDLSDDDEEDESNATLVAAIPRELLRGAGRGEEGPKSARGGLGQLFARGSEPRGVGEEEPSRPRTTTRPPPGEPEDVFTSAAALPTRTTKDKEALRRPSQLDAQEQVPDGAMYDPFAEPTATDNQIPKPRTAPLGEAPAPRKPPPAPKPPRPREGSLTEEDLEATVARAGTPAAKALDGLEARATSGAPAPRGHAPEPPPRAEAREATPIDGLAEALQHEGHVSPGPSLLSPDERHYDPNEETFVLSKKKAPEIDLLRVGDEDDHEPTRARLRAVGEPLPMRSWEEEKAAEGWLDEERRAALGARAEWLEEEARALEDRTARARGLLVVSEIVAILGDGDRAEALAVEARDLAPNLVMAHRQARALMPAPRDPARYVDAIDAELKHCASPGARVHGVLLAADALHRGGEDDASAKRYEQAFRIAPSDVRATVARTARALSRSETSSVALKAPDAPELASLARAVATCLRLRGVDRKDLAATEPSANDFARRARTAIDAGDAKTAAAAIADLSRVPELSRGALWLAAVIAAGRPATRPQAASWLAELVREGPDGERARHALAARAVELGDPEALRRALSDATTFDPATRAALEALLPGAGSTATPLPPEGELGPLAAALAAKVLPSEGEDHDARARERGLATAGAPQSRAAARVGRLLGAKTSDAELGDALGAFEDPPPAAIRVLRLELALRAQRYPAVIEALEAWGCEGSEAQRDRHLAAGLLAEHVGDSLRAAAAYRRAHAADPSAEAPVRALMSVDPGFDALGALRQLADDATDPVRSAVLGLETIARVDAGDQPETTDTTKLDWIERAHRAAPQLPIPTYLAERIARRSGNVDEVLRWVRERRANVSDPIESALDGVREAFFIADRDVAGAAARLEEAHQARRADVALRELYERMSLERPDDAAEWREQRAAATQGATRGLLSVEAAYEYERAGDWTGALRAAEAAVVADPEGLGRVIRDRAELRSGQVARLADELLELAKTSTDARERREAFARLAVVDELGRGDTASALLWHRSILEEEPQHPPSLRYVEHALISAGRDEDLEPVATTIAKMLANSGGGEGAAHAELAARLRLRGTEGSWEATREMVELAAAQPEPSLWSLRMLQAHARSRGDDKEYLATTDRLLSRMTRPGEIAAVLVRSAEAATRLEDLGRARELLERAAMEDPGDVVTWGLLADVRGRAGDPRGAAEACESLARTSVVAEHQLLAWYDAGRIWLDEVKDAERGLSALEQAAAKDVAFEDTFQRLSALYKERKSFGELASLLERRIEKLTDEAERLSLEVERGRVLMDLGDHGGARAAFEAALAVYPEHVGALGALADLCAAEKDWDAAEQAWVRLARLLPTPEEQKEIFARLGDLYATKSMNLSRAEVAFKEVLKRAPDDVPTMERLVDVYRREKDSARAVELTQELISRAKDPTEKRGRLLELADIYETTGHDVRRAEQALEAARREFPNDVRVLRAVAEFFGRQGKLPAINVMLDRVLGDARRAFAAGRLVPANFELMEAALELRGKKGASRVVAATRAALEARPAALEGAGFGQACDPRNDDLLCPEVLTPALRNLLLHTGTALDVVSPVDMRGLGAASLPPTAGAVGSIVGRVATALGLGGVHLYMSPRLGATCIPVSSAPPALVVGEGLGGLSEPVIVFLVTRALKLVLARASALMRVQGQELAVLVSAWLKTFNPTWVPQGLPANVIAETMRRVQGSLPQGLGPDIGVVALEVAGAMGTQAITLNGAVRAWANRAALLAVGDPNAALEGIARGLEQDSPPPAAADERLAWITKTPEAKDLVSYSMSDAYGELRGRLGLDKNPA